MDGVRFSILKANNPRSIYSFILSPKALEYFSMRRYITWEMEPGALMSHRDGMPANSPSKPSITAINSLDSQMDAYW